MNEPFKQGLTVVAVVLVFAFAFLPPTGCRKSDDDNGNANHGGKYGHHHQVAHEVDALQHRVSELEARLAKCVCAAVVKGHSKP